MALRSLPSPVSSRFALAGVALVALTLANAASHGFYSTAAAYGAVVALIAALLACARGLDGGVRWPTWLGPATLIGAVVGLLGQCWISDWPRDAARLALVVGLAFLGVCALRGRLRTPSLALTLLAAAALLLTGRAAVHTKLLASDQATALLVVRTAAGVGFLLVAAMVGLDLGATGGRGPGFRLRLALLFVAGAVLRLATVATWPDPSIDVLVWMRHSPRTLLAGANPYAPTEPLLDGLAAYPPLPILMVLPFSAAGVDVRYCNVICDLIAAGVLYLAARRAGRPLLGALAAGTYLNLPGVPFMLENAWYEPMLAALVGGGLLLSERRAWIGHLLIGLGVTGKQFGLPLVLPWWAASRGRRVPMLAGLGLAVLLVIVPFFLWSPRQFIDVVLTYHLAIGPDVGSLTARSITHRLTGAILPGWLASAITLLATCWIAYRTPQKGSCAALWLGAALLVFCLFYVKGYFNYFYLCNYLFLLGLAALPPEGEAAALTAPQPASILSFPGRRAKAA
jgi:hypothetical protein